ncbi:hypothetical protein SAMN04515647_1465 [Cohaesibacter sp. ES.047]|nr:hypothetical protein SAMN04515647_1465 [Cohaesibacter sp. ES.047]
MLFSPSSRKWSRIDLALISRAIHFADPALPNPLRDRKRGCCATAASRRSSPFAFDQGSRFSALGSARAESAEGLTGYRALHFNTKHDWLPGQLIL